jgi:hypothetical protein
MRRSPAFAQPPKATRPIIEPVQGTLSHTADGNMPLAQGEESPKRQARQTSSATC